MVTHQLQVRCMQARVSPLVKEQEEEKKIMVVTGNGDCDLWVIDSNEMLK